MTQLDTDEQTLLTELQSLATKSGVTIADLESLISDSQSIAESGFHFSAHTLNPVISELATAVAGATSTSQAQSDFNALFTGSSVSTTVMNTTFSDLVKAIGDSGVTTNDLTTVASDEAAIQTDLSKLPWFFQPVNDGLLDFEAGPFTSLSLSASAINLPTIFIAPGAMPVGQNLGSGLLGGLTDAGVVTSPIFAGQPPSSTGTSASAYAQLRMDLQKLQAELQTLASRSGLTVGDLESLTIDSQSIAQARFHFNPQTLNPVIAELAKAVANGTSTAQAQQDFTTLFSGSSVSSTVIDTTFTDLVKTITDSKVMPADLTTVAVDEAAIQTDFQNLHPKSTGGNPPTGTGTTGTGTTGTGTSGTSPVVPVHHRAHHPVRHPRFKAAVKHKSR